MENWIKASDRLPTKTMRVLLLLKSENDCCVEIEGTYMHTLGRFFLDGRASNLVTHWMPLPEPPKD